MLARAAGAAAIIVSKSGTSRKTRANGGHLISPFTQGIIVNLG